MDIDKTLFVDSYSYKDKQNDYLDKKDKSFLIEQLSVTVGNKYLGLSFSVKNNFFIAFLTGNKEKHFEYKILISNKKLLKSPNTKHSKKLYQLALKEALKYPDFSEKYYSK